LKDVSGRFSTAPEAKVLIALKLLAFGCSPSAFQDYFQMGEGTAQQCMLRFGRVVSSNAGLQEIYGRSMTQNDARRV